MNRKTVVKVLLIPLVLLQALIGAVGLGLLWVFDREKFRKVWAERPQKESVKE